MSKRTMATGGLQGAPEPNRKVISHAADGNRLDARLIVEILE